MIPASEKSRRKITAGEEGEIFELPDDIIEKEFRPITLDKSVERSTASELKKIYYTYRLARQIMPGHFVETAGAQKKDGSLKLYTRKVDVPEEDQERKKHINLMMEKAHQGEISENEIQAELKKYEEYIEKKYPEARALAEQYEKFGIEIPHWQLNALFDLKDDKIKFCEAILTTGQAGKLFNKIMENTDNIEDLYPRIESQLKIFILASFAYIEKNHYPVSEQELKELYVAANKAMSQLLRTLKRSGKDLEIWFTDKHLVETMFKLFNVEVLLRGREPVRVIDFYENIAAKMKSSSLQDPGIIVDLSRDYYTFEKK